MRTDIHRPSAVEFDPENYEFVSCFDLHPEQGNHKQARQVISNFVSQGYRFARPGNNCGHCGAHLRYVALMLHPSTMEMIYVGEQCLTNRFESLTKSEFQKLREEAKLNRERATTSERLADFLRENPDAQALIEFIDTNSTGENSFGYYGSGFLLSLYEQLKRNATLSPKQVASIRPAIEREREEVSRAKARQEEKSALLASGVQAPEGRGTYEVTLIATKWVENDFGGQLKMLVQHASGWKAWLSMPEALEAEIGQQFAITATFTRSEDDSTFAYGKRPALPKTKQ